MDMASLVLATVRLVILQETELESDEMVHLQGMTASSHGSMLCGSVPRMSCAQRCGNSIRVAKRSGTQFGYLR
jgi:hypothetical protein